MVILYWVKSVKSTQINLTKWRLLKCTTIPNEWHSTVLYWLIDSISVYKTVSPILWPPDRDRAVTHEHSLDLRQEMIYHPCQARSASLTASGDSSEETTHMLSQNKMCSLEPFPYKDCLLTRDTSIDVFIHTWARKHSYTHFNCMWRNILHNIANRAPSVPTAVKNKGDKFMKLIFMPEACTRTHRQRSVMHTLIFVPCR